MAHACWPLADFNIPSGGGAGSTDVTIDPRLGMIKDNLRLPRRLAGPALTQWTAWDFRLQFNLSSSAQTSLCSPTGGRRFPRFLIPMNMPMKMLRLGKGFSLIEMMVAMVAGLVVIGAVVVFTIATSQSSTTNIRSVRLMQNLRTSLSLIERRFAVRLQQSALTMPANAPSASGVCPTGVFNQARRRQSHVPRRQLRQFCQRDGRRRRCWRISRVPPEERTPLA